MSSRDFYKDIEKFNDIYRLQGNAQPTPLGPERIESFHNIIAEEVDEAKDILAKYREALERGGEAGLSEEARLEVLTDMADWLGDIVVYCASEARRWGLPLPSVLDVIMESNFSKLGADGEPIYDARGKVMKGPNYWKPEPRIREILEK